MAPRAPLSKWTSTVPASSLLTVTGPLSILSTGAIPKVGLWAAAGTEQG